MPRTSVLFHRDARLALAACAAALSVAAAMPAAAQAPAAQPAAATTTTPSSGFAGMMNAMEGTVRATKSMPMTGNVDRDFATMMISHHEAGIAMSKIEQAGGTHAPLRKLAAQDIAAQEKDNAEMRRYLQTLPTTATPNGAKASEGMMSAMSDMNKVMQGVKSTGNQDRDFIVQMIPHHDSAIDMANAELRYGRDARVKKVARGIVKSQTKDITNMKKWHQAWFGVPFHVGEQEHD